MADDTDTKRVPLPFSRGISIMSKRMPPLAVERLEHRALPSVTVVPPIIGVPIADVRADLVQIDRTADAFQQRVAHLEKDIAADIAKGGDVRADLNKLDLLIDDYSHGIHKLTADLLKDGLGGDLKADVRYIRHLTTGLEHSLDKKVTDLRQDIAHHGDVGHDLAGIHDAVKDYEAHIDHAVTDALHDAPPIPVL
jgi:hypothetical protein